MEVKLKFEMAEKENASVLCDVSSSDSSVVDDSSLLGYHAMSIHSHRRFEVLGCITANMKVIYCYEKLINRLVVTSQKT